MQGNRFYTVAIVGLALVPVAVAGMLWSVWNLPMSGVSANALSQASAQTNKLDDKQARPDEPLSNTLTQRFSLNNSLNRLQQIEQALASFRRLTETSQAKLGKAATDRVGNTDWETQNLGFPNWLGSVNGTLRQQDYQIKKLEYDLAKKQFEDGQINRATLDQKAAAYKKAQQDFQAFLRSFKVVD